jgi:hypothetical protein
MNALGSLTKEVYILVSALAFCLYVFMQQSDGDPERNRNM